jgi:three-Cys-motif partner protein
MDEAAVPHRDELRVVEDHHQTEHKLDLIRRYYGAYLSIVARAQRLPNNGEAWIVDTHAGAGLHRSREDPDQRRFGSPLIACSQARLAQRRHAGFRVHVRAIEKDERWQARLDRRVEVFRHGERAEDRVDVRTLDRDFAERIPDVLAETAAARALSLWFVDPYGFGDIPFLAFGPLLPPALGTRTELLINLDLTGIWRKKGSVDDIGDVNEVLDGQPDQLRALRALYGGDQWRGALRPDTSLAVNLESLAAAYAERFRTFRYRRPYRLRSSDGQVRFMVHLSQVETAHREFQRCYESSLRTGLLAGRALDTARRGQAAHALFEMYRGATTTTEELFEAASPPLDRSQLRVVLREADARGFGHFDEHAGTMTWSAERAGPQLDLRLE